MALQRIPCGPNSLDSDFMRAIPAARETELGPLAAAWRFGRHGQREDGGATADFSGRAGPPWSVAPRP